MINLITSKQLTGYTRNEKDFITFFSVHSKNSVLVSIVSETANMKLDDIFDLQLTQ